MTSSLNIYYVYIVYDSLWPSIINIYSNMIKLNYHIPLVGGGIPPPFPRATTVGRSCTTTTGSTPWCWWSMNDFYF